MRSIKNILALYLEVNLLLDRVTVVQRETQALQ